VIDQEDEETRSFLSRYRAPIGVAVAVAIIGLAAFFLMPRGDSKPQRKVQEVTVVKLQPPPPPPPPPPTPPPPQMQQPKMMDAEPIKEPDARPKEADPPPLGLDAKGEGPGDSFGLAGRPGGSGLLGGNGNGEGSKFARFNSILNSAVEKALQNNSKTRSFRGIVSAMLWLDANGQVTRVELIKASGDRDIDAATKDEVLARIRVEPPPKDMPMPVVVNLRFRAPA
jgi:periplasmic protein TonB